MKLTRLKSERPRRKYDFYPTPYGLAKSAFEALWLDEYPMFYGMTLDVGAGEGVWGKAIKNTYPIMAYGDENYDAFVSGIDIESYPTPDEYDAWFDETDYLTYETRIKYDLIIGNPPYSLMEEFVRKSFTLLNQSGYIFFLGRLEFLASRKRYIGLFKDHPLHSVYVLSRRPSFFSTNGRKTTDAQDYAMYLWQDGYNKPPELKWLYWEYDKKYD